MFAPSCRLELAKSVQFQDTAKAAAHAELDFDEMARQIALVRNHCDKTNSPVVFCHNDLLSGNIMAVSYTHLTLPTKRIV